MDISLFMTVIDEDQKDKNRSKKSGEDSDLKEDESVPAE
jgi:hypothetical protein